MTTPSLPGRGFQPITSTAGTTLDNLPSIPQTTAGGAGGDGSQFNAILGSVVGGVQSIFGTQQQPVYGAPVATQQGSGLNIATVALVLVLVAVVVGGLYAITRK